MQLQDLANSKMQPLANINGESVYIEKNTQSASTFRYRYGDCKLFGSEVWILVVDTNLGVSTLYASWLNVDSGYKLLVKYRFW